MRTGRRGSLLESKILKLEQLRKKLSSLKAEGKAVVFTNGCFDILHYGHVKYLEDAAARGDILVVGINSDSSIKRIKGKNRPIVNEKDRLRTVAGLQAVDFVVLFREDTPIKVIRAVIPDILIKGSDWSRKNIVGSEFVEANGGKVLTVKLVQGRSTTALINKIAKSSKDKQC